MLILVAGATFVTVRLVVDPIRGGPETNSPGDLLRVGALTWAYVVITFSFLFWALDDGGPENQARLSPEYLVWRFLSTSTLVSLDQGGAPNSSTICTSPIRTPLRSVRPM